MFVLNKKWAPYILILLLAVAVIIIRTCKKNDQPQPKPKITHNDRKDPAANVDRDRGFDRRISYLEYSKHAKCRMQCRHISQVEVEEIMRNGEINYYKSDLKNARCPHFAVEGVTVDKQDVRIVFAQCNEKTEVVTVIDLSTEWQCHCPGDDAGSASSPYENRN